MSSRYLHSLWRNTSVGKRARRSWTDLPGRPARYLHARRRGIRRFAVALVGAVAGAALALAVLA